MINKINIPINKNLMKWESLVGEESESIHGKTICYNYTTDPVCSLEIAEEYLGKKYSHKIPILDTVFVCGLLDNLGFEIVFEEQSEYTMDSITKAQALIVVGFSRLIKQNDDYSVDNVFTQNFLTQEELAYLLDEGVEEMLLSDIK